MRYNHDMNVSVIAGLGGSGAGTNGARFVSAYNVIDHSLRTQYNFKSNISFTDLIRRCASLNTVVRIHEDDLVDLARLRNAIVHNKSDTLIAEPNLEVVELFEKIAKLVTTPPVAVDVIKSREVAVLHADMYLNELIVEAARMGFGSIPIYKNNNLIGVWRKYRFVEVVGSHVIPRGESVDKFIATTTGEDFIRTFPANNHYHLASRHITIEEVLTLFNANRKLACIIITEDGTASCRPLGIITPGDLIDLMKVLESF